MSVTESLIFTACEREFPRSGPPGKSSEFFITEICHGKRITPTSCDDRLLGPANIATRVSIGTGTRPRNLMNQLVGFVFGTSPFFRAILEPVLTPVFPTYLIIKSNPRQSDRTTKTHFHCRLYAFSGFPEPVDPTVTPSPNPNIESSTTAIRYSNEFTIQKAANRRNKHRKGSLRLQTVCSVCSVRTIAAAVVTTAAASRMIVFRFSIRMRPTPASRFADRPLGAHRPQPPYVRRRSTLQR